MFFSSLRLFLGALSIIVPASAMAEFRLIDRTSKGAETLFVLNYTASADALQGEEAVPSWPSELAEELMDPGWKPSSRPPRMESVLLSVPDSTEWAVTAKGAPEGAFELRRVEVGPYSAIQIIAQTELLAGREWRLEVSGPAGKAVQVRTPEDSITAGLFLNGILQDAVVGRKSAPLPEPPAPWRLRYREGERLARFLVPEAVSEGSLRVMHQGRALAWMPAGPGEGILYLPLRTNIGTDRHDAIFLANDPGAPSAELSTRPAFATLTPQLQEAPIERSRLYRPRLVYERATPFPIGDRFIQYRLARTQTRTTNYAFPDRLAFGSVSVRVEALGLNALTDVTPDHFANFSLGGVSAGETRSWDGRTLFIDEFDAALDPLSFPGGEGQTISFTHNIPAIVGGPGADLQNLDSVTLSWTGFPRVGPEHRLLVKLEEKALPRLITVGGFPAGTTAADLHVLDVTDEANPVLLTSPVTFVDQSGTIAVEWEAPAQSGSYLVDLLSNLEAPLQPAQTVSLAGVTTETLRGIYVCPAELRQSLQPLLDLRGPGNLVLDPDAAYDAYAMGQESPQAIKDALRDIISSAADALPFPSVVLVGHASFDRRDYLGLLNAPQIPTFIDESIDTSFTIENCVDFPYALLFGEDDFVDVNLARIPAMSAAELDHMVARILAHEAAAAELSELERPGLFAYDNDPTILFDKPLWAALWEGTKRPIREVVIAPSSTGVTESAELRSFLEEQPRGPAFVMYTGHGNNTIWGSVGLLRADEIALIETRGGYPFVTTFTCLNSYYAYPGAGVRSMSERWLLAPLERGGSASYAAGSVDYYGAQRIKAELFLKILSAGDRPRSVGELVTRTRLAYTAARPDLALTNREYLLFGDSMTPTTIPPTNLISGWRIY